jgi:DNA-binding CsgD family transcriptional regulator
VEADLPGPVTPLPPLSRTQRDVLRCLVRGMADKEISAHLQLSPHTVDYHLRQLRKRFGARNRVQLLLASRPALGAAEAAGPGGGPPVPAGVPTTGR